MIKDGSIEEVVESNHIIRPQTPQGTKPWFMKAAQKDRKAFFTYELKRNVLFLVFSERLHLVVYARY